MILWRQEGRMRCNGCWQKHGALRHLLLHIARDREIWKRFVSYFSFYSLCHQLSTIELSFYFLLTRGHARRTTWMNSGMQHVRNRRYTYPQQIVLNLSHDLNSCFVDTLNIHWNGLLIQQWPTDSTKNGYTAYPIWIGQKNSFTTNANRLRSQYEIAVSCSRRPLNM